MSRGVLGNASVVQDLVRVIWRDNHKEAQCGATVALRELGTPTVTHVLERYLSWQETDRHGDSFREAVERAIEKLRR